METGSRTKLLIAASLLAVGSISSSKAITSAEDQLYKQVAPAVVFIYGADDQSAISGTGTIIRDDGYVLTSAQVLRSPLTQKSYDKLFVFLKPDRVTGSIEKDLQKQHAFPAVVVNTNPELDLGLIKLVSLGREISDLPRVRLAASEALAPGAEIYAFGHAGKGALWSESPGKLGGFAENYSNVRGWGVYQHTIPIMPGYSGGPLMADDGTQIGINTFANDGTANRDAQAVTINFAVSSGTARRWINSVMGKNFLPDGTEHSATTAGGYLPPAATAKATQKESSASVASYLPPETAKAIKKQPVMPATTADSLPSPTDSPSAAKAQKQPAAGLPRIDTVDFDTYLARLKKSAQETLAHPAPVLASGSQREAVDKSFPIAPTQDNKGFNTFLKNLKASQP